MKLKADWLEHLHRTRRREIEIIFDPCPKEVFPEMLEIGAGDGFQSALLKDYTKHLTCTEYDEQKLQNKIESSKIDYKLCDAEALPTYFKPKSFDVVFSSNLLEHLYHPDKVFADIHTILKDDGVSIHIMPSPFLKLCWLFLFYPNQALTLLEKVTEKDGAKALAKVSQGDKEELQKLRTDLGNNPKEEKKSWLAAQFWPTVHGAYPNHLAELKGYSKKRWIRTIEAAGFDVIAVKKMPVSSGYGFGFDRVRRILEKYGSTSSYAYIAVKKDSQSPYRKYFN